MPEQHEDPDDAVRRIAGLPPYAAMSGVLACGECRMPLGTRHSDTCSGRHYEEWVGGEATRLKAGRTIYQQLGREPADGDLLIGQLDTRELAEQAVAAVNALARVRALADELDDRRQGRVANLQLVAALIRQALGDAEPQRQPWQIRAAATGGGPCETCGRPRNVHVCLSCSPDYQTPGAGCLNCRHTGWDQTPCQTPQPTPLGPALGQPTEVANEPDQEADHG